MTRPGIEPMSPGPLENTLPTRQWAKSLSLLTWCRWVLQLVWFINSISSTICTFIALSIITLSFLHQSKRHYRLVYCYHHHYCHPNWYHSCIIIYVFNQYYLWEFEEINGFFCIAFALANRISCQPGWKNWWLNKGLQRRDMTNDKAWQVRPHKLLLRAVNTVTSYDHWHIAGNNSQCPLGEMSWMASHGQLLWWPTRW